MEIPLIPVASALHDPRTTAKVLDEHLNLLNGLYDFKLDLVTDQAAISSIRSTISDSSGLLVLVLTGGTEHLILELSRLERPMLLVAHPTQNSLPACLEATPAIRKNAYARIAYGRGEDLRKSVSSFCSAVRAAKKIRGAQILLVGAPSPWLVFSRVEPTKLKEKLNITLSEIQISSLLRELEAEDEDSAKGVIPCLLDHKSAEISEMDLLAANKLYLTMKRVAKGSPLTIRCFDLLDTGCTACLAVSSLIDDGVPAGCEGDVPALLTMMALMYATRGPAFMANLSDIDGGNLMFSHCAIATSMTSDFTLRTHFESGKGVGVAGVLEEGIQVTVARIDPGLEELLAFEGLITQGRPLSEHHCRTQVWITPEGNAGLLLEEPVGNHFVIAHGRWGQAIKDLAGILKLKLKNLGP